MSLKHELGRAAYRRGDYAEAERLAEEAYQETTNQHSFLNFKVAQHAQGKISKSELDKVVHDLGLQNDGHGRSVLRQGY